MKNRKLSITLKAAIFIISAFIARDVFCSGEQFYTDLNCNENTASNMESSLNILNKELEMKNAEIEKLRNENNELRERADVQTAGINPGVVSISLILMFSAVTGFVSVTIAKRKTRSLCHCNNRRMKLMKMNKNQNNILH